MRSHSQRANPTNSEDFIAHLRGISNDLLKLQKDLNQLIETATVCFQNDSSIRSRTNASSPSLDAVSHRFNSTLRESILRAVEALTSANALYTTEYLVASLVDQDDGLPPFTDAVSQLFSGGLLTNNGKNLALTQEGKDALVSFPKYDVSTEILCEAIAKRLSKTSAQILRLTQGAGNTGISHDELAAALRKAKTNSTLTQAIHELRSKNLIARSSDGRIVLSDMLLIGP